jgi:hypothetical protein
MQHKDHLNGSEQQGTKINQANVVKIPHNNGKKKFPGILQSPL